MRVRVLIATIVLFAWPIGAEAQWLHTVKEDAFGSDTHISMTAAGGMLFGFNCDEKGARNILFLTREEWDDKLSIAPFKLLVKIDKGETISLEATATEVEDRLRLDSDDDRIVDVMKQIAAAKSRVDVAAEMFGQTFYAQKIGVAGSSSAIGKMMKACKLE